MQTQQEPIPLAPASHEIVNNFATVSAKSATVVLEVSPPGKPTVANISDNMVIERSASPPPPPPSSASSGFSDDDSLHFDDGRGMTLEEFARHVKTKSKQGLYHEYADIKAKGTDRTFNNSR